MLWRIILSYPLGNTKAISPSILINIVGTQTGTPTYSSIEEILSQPNVFVHLYGKEISKPGRKMGHINLLGNNKENLLEQAHSIKGLLSQLC
jgi:5-(carboxyamino)imidazole ribonucleotide synthase